MLVINKGWAADHRARCVISWWHVGGEVADVFLVRVLEAAQAKLAARVLPCLPLTIPMETKLRQLCRNSGAGVSRNVTQTHLPTTSARLNKPGLLVFKSSKTLWWARCGFSSVPRYQSASDCLASPLAQLRPVLPVCCVVLLNCADLLLSPI